MCENISFPTCPSWTFTFIFMVSACFAIRNWTQGHLGAKHLLYPWPTSWDPCSHLYLKLRSFDSLCPWSTEIPWFVCQCFAMYCFCCWFCKHGHTPVAVIIDTCLFLFFLRFPLQIKILSDDSSIPPPLGVMFPLSSSESYIFLTFLLCMLSCSIDLFAHSPANKTLHCWNFTADFKIWQSSSSSFGKMLPTFLICLIFLNLELFYKCLLH